MSVDRGVRHPHPSLCLCLSTPSCPTVSIAACCFPHFPLFLLLCASCFPSLQSSFTSSLPISSHPIPPLAFVTSCKKCCPFRSAPSIPSSSTQHLSPTRLDLLISVSLLSTHVPWSLAKQEAPVLGSGKQLHTKYPAVCRGFSTRIQMFYNYSPTLQATADPKEELPITKRPTARIK